MKIIYILNVLKSHNEELVELMVVNKAPIRGLGSKKDFLYGSFQNGVDQVVGAVKSVTTTYTTLVSIPSDGVVNQESAWSLPGVGTAKYKALGVNHEQLKNSLEMKRIFQNIFDGRYDPSDGSDFFVARKRNQ